MCVVSRALLALCVLLAGLSVGTAASASAVAPDDALGRWLETEVAPELGELLSRHPNYRREVVGFVTLAGGVPQPRSSALHLAVEQFLRQRLLAFDGVRLALDAGRPACGIPQPVHYVIAIEIGELDAREATVSLGMLDLEAGVWVSGVSQQWRGRLATHQRAALATPVSRASPGSADAPLSMGETRALALALAERMRCVLPDGLDGPLFVMDPETAELRRVTLALQRELLVSPVAVLTERERDARWRMRLAAEQAGAGLMEVSLALNDADGGSNQRLASVFVAGFVDPARGVPAPAPATVTRPPVVIAEVAAPRLSALRVEEVSREGVCRRGRDERCAEVSFELHEPSYLVVFSTQGDRVSVPGCGDRLQRSDSGERRFRLRVRERRAGVGRGAAAGFYALAVEDRETAEQLQALLERAPGACHADPDTTKASWLDGLQSALARHGQRVQWQALHLDAGVNRL